MVTWENCQEIFRDIYIGDSPVAPRLDAKYLATAGKPHDTLGLQYFLFPVAAIQIEQVFPVSGDIPINTVSKPLSADAVVHSFTKLNP